MAIPFKSDDPSGEDVSSKKPWVQWLNLKNGETGIPFISRGVADKTVQVTGTFSPGTIILEGSINGGTIYFQLTDPLGNDLSFTAAGAKAVLENVIHIRPRITAGDGSTDISVYLLSNSPI